MSYSVWAPKQYGWDVVYFVMIEGIPTIFIERATTLTLEAGYTQDASLVVDLSSDVGSEVSPSDPMGKGLPFTMHLLDTAAVRGWMVRWVQECHLRSAALSGAATLAVDNTSAWPAAGTAWIGMECITYTGKTAGPDTLTGVTRGKYGSLPTPHGASEVAGKVTSMPRIWRGRGVRLFAVAVDPAGFTPGTTLLSEAEEVWRGTIDRGPTRAKSLWQFDCLSLDRRLAHQVVAPVTGTVVDTIGRYPIMASQFYGVHVCAWDSTNPAIANKVYEFYVGVSPYAALSDGTLLTTEEQISYLEGEWTTALAGAVNLVGGAINGNTYLGALKFRQLPKDKQNPNAYVGQASYYAGSWDADLYLKNVGGAAVVTLLASVNGNPLGQAQTTTNPYLPELHWLHWNSGPDILKTASSQGYKPLSETGIAVDLDVATDALPATGKLTVGTWSTNYGAVTLLAGSQTAFFSSLSAQKTVPANLAGQSAEIRFWALGSFANVMRQLLVSSGETALRSAVYDVLGAGQGYGMEADVAALSAVDEASFAKFANGPMADMQASIVGSGKSWAELFEGILALSSRAVAARQDSGTGARRVRIGLVSTAPGGSAYTGTLTDQHLMTGDGAAVETLHLDPPPNTVSILARQGEDDGEQYAVADGSSAAIVGVVEQEFVLPILGKPNVDKVGAWVQGLFSTSQTLQLQQLRLVPWAIPAGLEVGDLVEWITTHYAVWRWSTGTTGYSGLARALSVKRRLLDGMMTVTLLADGATATPALCPAAPVVAVVGGAGTPATVDIEARFYDHMAKALEIGAAPFILVPYDPGYGNEGGGGTLTISAVALTAAVGGVCRLTVSAYAGVTLFVSRTYLTLPPVATSNSLQVRFAHTGTGSWS